jgi:predicted alpha/beta-hydrolase family hydrolase
MSDTTFTLPVSDSIGNVSASYRLPDNPVCIMTLAHGAGANMNHAFMVAIAEALAQENIATLRFNFPFMENKKGRPDVPAVAHKTIEAAIHHTREKHPKLPLFLSGKSFGGRMSSQYLSAHPDPLVKGIVFYGFPLHPMGKPSTERAEHLKTIKQPMLFLQGTKDTLAEWGLVEGLCATLPGATLMKIDGADHSFKKGKENLVPMLARETAGWINRVRTGQ